MERTNFLRTARIGYVVISGVLAALGIFLALEPDTSLIILGRIFGAVLVAFGVIRIIGYWSRDLFRLAFQYDLALGILLMVLGGIIISKPGEMLDMLCMVVGVYVLIDGLLKIQIALDSRRFGITKWWLIMTAAIVTGVIGLLLVFRPADSIRIMAVLLGASMLFEGILNLITVLTAVKIMGNR